MIEIRSSKEIRLIQRAGVIVRETLSMLCENARPGRNTKDLNDLAESMIAKMGGIPAFKGYRGYPCSICASVNSSVVHEIPSLKRVLKEGDIISYDVGVKLDGYFADAAVTHPVGNISEKAKKLMSCTRRSLELGIAEAREGKRVSDISHAVQKFVESHGFSVVRQFVGHGIGRALHEEPEIPNFGNPNTGKRLKEGMVLAIEPMVNEGAFGIKVLEDGWTAVTEDGLLSAHFEHTVAVGKERALILT